MFYKDLQLLTIWEFIHTCYFMINIAYRINFGTLASTLSTYTFLSGYYSALGKIQWLVTYQNVGSTGINKYLILLIKCSKILKYTIF